jgi:hypothetical protein
MSTFIQKVYSVFDFKSLELQTNKLLIKGFHIIQGTLKGMFFRFNSEHWSMEQTYKKG